MAAMIRPEDIRRIIAEGDRQTAGESGERAEETAPRQHRPEPPIVPANPPPVQPRAERQASQSAEPVFAPAEPQRPDRFDEQVWEPETSPDEEWQEEAWTEEAEPRQGYDGPPLDYPEEEAWEDDEEEEQRPARRWLFPLVIALVALVGFAAVLIYALQGDGPRGSGEAPVLQAQNPVDKIKPSEPGGLQVPNRDVEVLNQAPALPEPGSVVLQPPPEEPQPLPPAPEPEPAAVAATGDTAGVTITPPGQSASADPAGGDTASEPRPTRLAGPALAIPPRPTAKLDGREASVAASLAAPAGTAAAQAAPAAQPAAAAPEAAPQAAAITAPAAGGAGGGFLVQLAALTSAAAADQSWQSVSSRHASLLGSLTPSVQRAEIAGRGTFFRLRAGPLESRAAAASLCEKLKAAGQACIVVAQ
ncbi:MAG: hypothetical protein Kilf2KO_21440 [Rhodospirillales bacterium]